MQSLLNVDIKQWKAEMDSVGEYLQSYGDRLPPDLKREYDDVVADLQKAS